MTTRSMPRLYQAVLLTIVVLGLVGYYWEGRDGGTGSEGSEEREGLTVVGDTKGGEEKAKDHLSSEEAEKHMFPLLA